jgi:thiamine-monophosphate kinase
MIDKESYFISLFPNTHIGDDGAIIAQTVYSKDLFCENIHFKRTWMSLEQIAYKSMLVNISDAIAMNAKPAYALIGIKIPASFSTEELDALSAGFLKAAAAFSFEIIGGDTVAGESLDISITLISHTDNPLTRLGLEVGDIVGYTGELGSVKKDLDALFSGEKIPDTSKFITPTLRADFLYKVAPFLVAGMDISDGLSKDLSRLSSLNHKGFAFFGDISNDILCSGEEYEILFVCKEKNLDTIINISKETNTPITFFAKVVEGSYQSICKENHFE